MVAILIKLRAIYIEKQRAVKKDFPCQITNFLLQNKAYKLTKGIRTPPPPHGWEVIWR